MRNRRFGLMIVVLAGALAAQAGQYWWSGNGTTLGGNGTWDTSLTRWGTSVAGPFTTVWPNGGGDEAVFTNAAGTVTLGATAIKVNKMNFIGSTQNWTFNSGTLDFGSNGSVAITNNDHVTLNSSITGTGTLTLNFKEATLNSGWARGITLYGNNSAFTGKMSFQKTAGSYFWLYATNDFNFGAAPGVYTADALTLNGVILQNAANNLINIPANRGITLGSGGLQVYNGALGTINFNSIITGSAGVTFSASTGTINLNNVNSYSGQTRPYGGKIAIGIDNALPHGTGKDHIGFACWDRAVTLDLNGHVVTINGLWNQAATYDAGSSIDNSAAGAATLIVGDNNANNYTFPLTIKNTGGALSVTKIGAGIQTLSGTNTYSGTTTVNGGTLVVSGTMTGTSALVVNPGGTLQADLSTKTTGVFNPASSVTLAGGTLNIKGKNSGTSSQTLGNPVVNPASSTISITPNGGSGTTLTLGNTWTRQSGGTLLVDMSTAGSAVSSSPALTNGIIGGYAFVKDGTGTGFATVSGGNVVRYTGATVLDAATAAANLNGTVNYMVTNGVTLTGSSATQTVNSISITGVAGTSMIVPNGKVLVVGAGGINYYATAWARLTSGGYITSGTGDLVFNTSGSAPDVGTIVDNGATKVGVTVTGGIGLLLNAGNTYSGDTVINQGTIVRGGAIPNGPGKGNLLVNAGAAFEMGGGSGGINGLSQATNNTGGTVQNGYGSPVTLSLGNGDASASYSGTIIDAGTSYLTLIKAGTGTQTLAGASTYRGGTILSNGVLSVSSLNNIGGANAKVTFAGGTLRISGTAFTSFGATPLTFTSAGGGLDIVDAGNTLTLTNNLESGSVLTKTGSGTLTLTGTQAGTVTTDDPSKISFGSGLGFYNLGLTSGGVLSPAGSGMIGTVAMNNNLTLAGKLLVDVTASTNDMVTAGGSIALSAEATLEVVNTSLLNRSKQYTLMTAGGGAVSGSLTALNLPARWKVGAFGNAVVLYYVNPGTMVSFF